jgi:signal transduction histidine kinase
MRFGFRDGFEAWMTELTKRGGLLGFGAACVVLVVSGSISYSNLLEIGRNEAMVVHTYEVISALNQTMASVTDAETGQRGYIITGDKDYLLPHTTGLKDTEKHLVRLEDLVSDNPAQLKRVAELRKAVNVRLISLKRGVTLRDDRGFDAARDFVAEGLGKTQMRAIRTAIGKMMDDELVLLSERSARSAATYRTALVTLLLSTGVGLAMVGIAFGLAARDIANRQRTTQELERRVAERTEELNTMNAALQISNRELEQFASVASHDLQEPLRKIEAFGDRLKTRYNDSLDEQGRDFLDRVLVSASRMRSLINDLLNFSRVTTRAQPHELLNLSAIAADVVSDLEGRIGQVDGRVDIGPLPSVEADPVQIRQLLQNLIGNALKFHRPQVPPVVKVTGRMITSPAGKPLCELTVSDNGIGFEEIYLDRIFNVFQRLHGRNEYEGTGMGLAIARKIVERHAGTITARSKPGEGATFIIQLPTTQAHLTEKAEA